MRYADGSGCVGRDGLEGELPALAAAGALILLDVPPEDLASI